MDSEPHYLEVDSAKWVTYKKVKENGKFVFYEALHIDTYLPLVGENGELIPPTSVEPALFYY